MAFGLSDITISGFKEIFRKIVEEKKKAGIIGIFDNPPDLLERAKLYGVQYSNGSWGWSSNIWNRSAKESVVVEREEDLKPEHMQLMLRVLEHILCRPMIKVDGIIGKPGTRSQMKARLYCDPQFPDIAYRWSQLCYKGDPNDDPDVELFMIPHYLENPNVPGGSSMLRVIRFPNHNYTIVTVSSYQGEVKKGFLTHWIYHIYKVGGTGEHAALREFTVRKVDGKDKRIVMCVWGLTGSGKSTHGLYVVTERIGRKFRELFGLDPRDFIFDQVIKNDDIVGVFEDYVAGSEIGCWTKTEDVDEDQEMIYRASMSPRALHENTEWDGTGNVSFAGELFQYHGALNRNARSVLYLEDMGEYFDGDIDSSGPLNMAVFISPGYISDYAWVKINDPAFAAKVLADGRTTGHPAQGREGVGEEKYESRYCLPFTMGVGNAAHVNRFYEFMEGRAGTENPIDVYLINTTGRVGTQYEWVETVIGGKKIRIPKPKFKMEDGRVKPIGGTGPSIEETELFLFQAARGAVKYEPHPIYGEKVLVPVEVPGIPEWRLKELDPFSYRSYEEMREILKAQEIVSKAHLDVQCPGLYHFIYSAMDI